MQHKILGINNENEDKITYSSYLSYGSNDEDRKRMKNFLSIALGADLTGRQRQCIMMYYVDGLKMREIAGKLCIHPSTVTRHLRAAQRKLRNLSKYC